MMMNRLYIKLALSDAILSLALLILVCMYLQTRSTIVLCGLIIKSFLNPLCSQPNFGLYFATILYDAQIARLKDETLDT